MAGSFDVRPFPTDTASPDTVAFVGIAGVTAAPGDISLASSIGSDLGLVNRVASELYGQSYRNNEIFRGSYQSFLAAAKSGVEHPNGDRRIGETAQQSARAELLREMGRKYRDRYLAQTTKVSVWVLVLSGALLAAGLYVNVTFPVSDLTVYGGYVRSLGLVGIGIAVAYFLSTYLYLQDLTWDKLDVLDPNGLKPQYRLIAIGITAILLMALLDYDAIVLGIGPIVLNRFKEPGIAFLLGVLCGLSQVQVIKMLRNLFENVAQRQPPPSAG